MTDHRFESEGMSRMSEDEATYHYRCEVCGLETETSHPLTNDRLMRGMEPCPGPKIVIREVLDGD